MMSIELQACLMLVFLLSNPILVSPRPTDVQNFLFKRNPDTYVKFPIDDTLKLTVDENGDYHLIPDYEHQDQYPGYPKGEGNVCGRIEDAANHDDSPISYDDPEDPFVPTIGTNTDYGETEEPINEDDSAGEADILPRNSVKTIGQLEQEMHDYFDKLLSNTSSLPLDDGSNQTKQESPTGLEVDGNDTPTVTKEPEGLLLSSSTIMSKATQTKEKAVEPATVTKKPQGLLLSPSTTTTKATQTKEAVEPATVTKKPQGLLLSSSTMMSKATQTKEKAVEPATVTKKPQGLLLSPSTTTTKATQTKEAVEPATVTKKPQGLLLSSSTMMSKATQTKEKAVEPATVTKKPQGLLLSPSTTTTKATQTKEAVEPATVTKKPQGLLLSSSTMMSKATQTKEKAVEPATVTKKPLVLLLFSSTTTTKATQTKEEGVEPATVTKEPQSLLLSSSTTMSKATQGTKEEGGEPAPLEKQPNTLLFADPFEESNSGLFEDPDWGMPIADAITIRNPAIASNSVFDEAILTPHKNTSSTGLIGNQTGTESSTQSSDRIRDFSSGAKNQTINHAPSISNAFFQNPSQNGTVNYLEGVQKSPEKPARNLVPSFITRWELATKKVVPSPVLAVPHFGLGGRWAFTRRPNTDRAAFRIPASKNVEAQSQIISNLISTILRATINNSPKTRRQRRDNSPRVSKYHYSMLPSGEENISKHGRKKVIVVPARLIFKKSQRGSKYFKESGAEARRRDFEMQMEIFNRLSSGGSKHRKSYREDFEQVM